MPALRTSGCQLDCRRAHRTDLLATASGAHHYRYRSATPSGVGRSNRTGWPVVSTVDLPNGWTFTLATLTPEQEESDAAGVGLGRQLRGITPQPKVSQIDIDFSDRSKIVAEHRPVAEARRQCHRECPHWCLQGRETHAYQPRAPQTRTCVVEVAQRGLYITSCNTFLVPREGDRRCIRFGSILPILEPQAVSRTPRR